ncbi:PEP-CTERM sorting domain-containing protein [Duganella vulcania]|uniref:PEP-CTERM sorting domain-containing protein n=1 Tax=Duganella vulcania TaxID=2692166 RepID=UPI0020C49021|nr:PEP-CTERM sorting domain-containing protein [Duganella vulcania]
MTIKLFAAAAVVALSVFATQAHADQMWTVTTTGTVDQGYDSTGVFGTPNRNLAGLSFTQSVSVYVDGGRDPYFWDTVTMGGRTVTLYSSFTPESRQLIASKFDGSMDIIDNSQQGFTAAGNSFYVAQSVSNDTKSFVPSNDYAQVLGPIDVSDPSFSNYVYFSLTKWQFGDGSQEASFQSRSVKTISVNAVPEPETYAMLLAGLGLVGFAARRKRMAA